MTRKELVRHILKTYGQKATANGKEAWAVSRPLRKQSDEAPQCYLYTGTPDQKLLTGDLVQVGTEWYRVTRADVEWLEGESLYVWAVLRRGEGFAYCPIFDFGAGLLSNVREYSMEIQSRELLRQLIARPLNTTFPRKVSAARSIYGPQLQIGFAPEDVAEALAEPLEYYAERDRAYLANRVKTCIRVMEKKLKQR